MGGKFKKCGGQGGLVCCNSWGHKESDTTEWLNWTELNSLMVFPTFLNLSLNLAVKEFMIWAAVSSGSCFCWLYRASLSMTGRNRINLILVLTIWWCPCVVFSCVVERGCLLWPVHSLGWTLWAFALVYSVLKAAFACYSRCFWNS